MKNDYTNWTKEELCDLLVDNGIYEDMDAARLSDRCDLISEAEDLELEEEEEEEDTDYRYDRMKDEGY